MRSDIAAEWMSRATFGFGAAGSAQLLLDDRGDRERATERRRP
jgi:hypothetical protein